MAHIQAHDVGETLASAGDDGNILLWIPTDIPATAFGEDHAEDKESWRIKHMIRTNSGAEIYDLAWSPDGQYFITGGMDNTARIFNAHTGKSEAIRKTPSPTDCTRCNDTSNS